MCSPSLTPLLYASHDIFQAVGLVTTVPSSTIGLSLSRLGMERALLEAFIVH